MAYRPVEDGAVLVGLVPGSVGRLPVGAGASPATPGFHRWARPGADRGTDARLDYTVVISQSVYASACDVGTVEAKSSQNHLFLYLNFLF